ENPVEGEQLEGLGGEVREEDHRQTEEHLDGARSTDEIDDPIDDEGDDRDVDQVEETEVRDQLSHDLSNPRSWRAGRRVPAGSDLAARPAPCFAPTLVEASPERAEGREPGC